MWNVLTQFRTKRSFISKLDDDVYNIDETQKTLNTLCGQLSTRNLDDFFFLI